MTEALLLGGVLVACFVAYNVGGSTTGPAFGPAVGAGVVSKPVAAGLMSVCFFAGAWTLGRRVVDTLGRDLVTDPSLFTLPVSVVVLFFVGAALLVGNVSGAPASTSMTAVGAIAGLGVAADALEWAVVGEILAWWLVSPVVGFWTSVMIGRYVYPRIDRVVAIEHTDGPLLAVERSGPMPRPAPGPNTTRRELVGTAVVVAIGCLMAFSSGTSNIANAVAPLVGSGELGMDRAILVGSVAVAVGSFTIARRTMETLGNDITDLPLTAAIVVAVVSSTIVVVLSAAGIPASFVVIATMCIVGLGWGRATRTVTVADAVRGNDAAHVSVGALTAGDDSPTVGDPGPGTASATPRSIGDEAAEDLPEASALFDPSTTVRVVVMQNVVPVVATVASYLTFQFVVFA
ncbi:inorganic phosphate transporter [Halorussus halobius]|uniref:inorganic phosphate transporter n=1 Tax=Halorussus halobius TaxID=1710537 RepID=UPI0010926DEB|nr:inorganic phosphate transporter [Halorussus halobius]